VILLAGLTILKKKTWLGILNACRDDPEVALRLRNAADYSLPTFGSHGTKLGHSWFQWRDKRGFSGRFDNSEKEDVSGHFEAKLGWSRGCILPHKCCRLPSTYFWALWHQTRAVLISMINEKWIFWQVWQFRKRRRVLAFWAHAGMIPRLHSASWTLQTTTHPLLDHMAPN